MPQKYSYAARAMRPSSRRTTVAASMRPIAEIMRNPVAVTVTDGNQHFTITVQRQKGGQVRMTCDCPDGPAQGWCDHRLDLLCLRFDAAPHLDGAAKIAVEQIVTGTSLADDARAVDRARRTFLAALETFDAKRPAGFVGEKLTLFTELVSDLAASAGELEDAITLLRRRLKSSERVTLARP